MTSLADQLSGKTLLVTGSTGFLAKAFVAKAVRDLPGLRRIVLLIRAREQRGRRIRAAERLEREVLGSSAFRRLRAELGDAFEPTVAAKVIAVEGDLTEAGLGLSHDDRAVLADVDAVVNSAATVVFDEQVDMAAELNTRGVLRLLELARRLGDVPLLHVSTAYVCGRVDTLVPEGTPPLDRVVADDLEGRAAGTLDLDREVAGLDELAARARAEAARLPAPRVPDAEAEESRRRWLKDRLVELGMERARQRGWNDTYTYTKSLAERLLVRDHGSVPTTIVRPAIIESSLAEPEPGWIDGLRMADPLFAAFGKGVLRDFPMDPSAYVDFVPVDHVVNCMIAALGELVRRAADGPVTDVRVYHSATSAANPLRFQQLFELTRAYFRDHPLVGRDGRPVVPPEWTGAGEDAFVRGLQRRRRLLAAARTAARVVPGSSGRQLRGRLARLMAQLDRISYYFKIYRPYCAFPARFDTTRAEALLASLSAEDRRRFDFSPRGFDWATYIQDVHLPGLLRNVLREPAPPPMAHSAAEEDEPAEAAAAGGRTCFDLLLTTVERHGERPGLRRHGEVRRTEWSHRELLERALGAASILRAAGVRRGDRVLLQSESRPEWVAAWFGVVAAGATAVPLDAQTTSSRAEAVARLTGARATVLSARCREALGAAVLPGVTDVEALAAERLALPAAQRRGLPVGVSSEAPASILFTSGTTLEPKGVVLPHRALLGNVDSILPVLLPVAEDRLVSVLPLHHAFELTAGLLAPLSVGASITYLETLSSETIVAALRETRATVLLGVPRLFELMLEGIHRQVARLSAGRSVALGALSGASRAFRALGLSAGRSLSPLHARFGGCLRAFVSGGSPLPPEVLEGFRELGFTIVEGYGLTETAPVVAVNPLDGARAGSVGKPLPGVEVRIHAPAEDGVGEIVVRGPNVMSGYYRDPEATARVLRAGWFHTGDLGRFDADSYLYLTGRLKDLIVTSSGKNVYPEEVEVELKDLPGVKESCVVGVRARSGGGEEVHLVVVLEGDDTEAAHAAVRAEVARRGARLSSHQRVQRVHFWTAELPKTALLKVKRGAVKARLEGEEVEPAAGDASLGDEQHPVAREVVAVLARLTRVPLPALRADQSLSFDLGVDSLMRVELAVALEAAGGPRLSDEAVQELSTVRDLLELARIAHPGPRRSRRGALRLPSAESGPRTSAGVAILSKTTAPIVRATWPLLYLRYLDLEVRGRELLPAQGPYILAANHQSHLDAGAVLTALGGESRRLHVVAARDYFFDTPLKGGFFAELMNAIPFDRQGDFAPGLAACRGALEAGDPLLIFPEGTRSPDGRLQEFKAGLGILALELGVPVVPTCIEGTHAAMPKGARFPRRRPVRVTFGDPVDPGAVAPEGDALPYERYRAVVEAVRREIALLAAGRAAVASG